jgi:hypothetical protein
MSCNINLYLDQEVYDFIDPNTEDVAVPEEGDTHIGSFVSFLKVNKQNSMNIVNIHFILIIQKYTMKFTMIILLFIRGKKRALKNLRKMKNRQMKKSKYSLLFEIQYEL